MSQMSLSSADEQKNRLEEAGLSSQSGQSSQDDRRESNERPAPKDPSDQEARFGQDQKPSLYSRFPSLNKPADADFSHVIADYQEALESLQDQLDSRAS